jgi:hypothetical protein
VTVSVSCDVTPSSQAEGRPAATITSTALLVVTSQNEAILKGSSLWISQFIVIFTFDIFHYVLDVT